MPPSATSAREWKRPPATAVREDVSGRPVKLMGAATAHTVEGASGESWPASLEPKPQRAGVPRERPSEWSAPAPTARRGGSPPTCCVTTPSPEGFPRPSWP
eukprot:679930-Prymnesium_polylepis.1